MEGGSVPSVTPNTSLLSTVIQYEMTMPATDAASVKAIDRKARLQVPHQPIPKQKPKQ